MSEIHSPFFTFHLTGQRSGDDLGDAGQEGLRPALFSAYRNLSKLRYDLPLVLINGANGSGFLHSLTDIINDLLLEIAPRGMDGERLRRHVLRLEEEIRSLTQNGNSGTLFQIWDLAEAALLSQEDETGRKSLEDSLSLARAARRRDGEIIDCDDATPIKILTRAWTEVQESKARRFAQVLGELTLKLGNILKVDATKSEAAFEAGLLKKSVGSSYEDAFDFDSMSDILETAFVDGALPEQRRQRIRSVLSTLKSQKFFPSAGEDGKTGRRKKPHAFVFNQCSTALEAFQERLPEMADLVKAMTVASLEIEGRYKDSTHDPFFDRFDERFLEPGDLASFPAYLVCLRGGADLRAEMAPLTEILSSGLPIKVLVQNDDILEEMSIAAEQFSLGVQGSQIATMALGLANVYVLQASAASLYGLRDSILGGLMHNGPALFNISSGLAGPPNGAAKNAPSTQTYLRAAAALDSRAFPTFVHDPARGSDWAARFSLDGNPQLEADWPVHRFAYEDDGLQRTAQDVAFTFVDFAAADGRYSASFASVKRPEWREFMVPVAAFLELEADAATERVPYILMVDENNVLCRAIVEVNLIQAARRCREMWRSLQELGGINNSHARNLLAQEKELWQQEKARELASSSRRPEHEQAAPAPAAPVPAAAEAPAAADAPADVDVEAPAAASDEPYIETPRCTTCDECTGINNRMFAYDENKQAHIVDASAGTYREMVEAAESCQVAIIHPGKPKNPDEPGLDDLIARAEAFD